MNAAVNDALFAAITVSDWPFKNDSDVLANFTTVPAWRPFAAVTVMMLLVTEVAVTFIKKGLNVPHVALV